MGIGAHGARKLRLLLLRQLTPGSLLGACAGVRVRARVKARVRVRVRLRVMVRVRVRGPELAMRSRTSPDLGSRSSLDGLLGRAPLGLPCVLSVERGVLDMLGTRSSIVPTTKRISFDHQATQPGRIQVEGAELGNVPIGIAGLISWKCPHNGEGDKGPTRANMISGQHDRCK